MQESNATKLFNRLGIAVNDAAADDGVITVALTPVQFERLQAVVKSTQYAGTDGRYMVATLEEAELKEAVANNAKAPRRAGGVNVEIVSRMTYEVTAAEANNLVTYAEWCASENAGYIRVNEREISILTSTAGEVYADDEPDENGEVREVSDPERTVYLVVFTSLDGETGEESVVTLSAYGVTNLIRRVCAHAGEIIK